MVEVPPKPICLGDKNATIITPNLCYFMLFQYSHEIKLSKYDSYIKLGNYSVIPPYVIILWLFVIQPYGNINEWSGWWRLAYADEYNFIYAAIITSVCFLCSTSTSHWATDRNTMRTGISTTGGYILHNLSWNNLYNIVECDRYNRYFKHLV